MRTIQRANKTELALNDQQTTACKQHAGAARWAYNWGLARKQETYRATGTSPAAMDLHRELNALKHTDVPGMYEVSKCAPQEALRNLDTAFAHFFRRAQLKQRGKLRGKIGYPTRKTRKRGLGGLRLTGSIVVFSGAIQAPRLGRLRLNERGSLPTATKILSATVSEPARHWYLSVLVEQEHIAPITRGPAVGVALGVKTLATMSSDGTTIPNRQPLKRRLKKLKRWQRAVSRTRKGSHNRRKAVPRRARLHRRVANQRANTVQPLTSRLATTTSVVVTTTSVVVTTTSVVVSEDRNRSGLLKNHHWAQASGDVGFGELRRQLVDTAAWCGCRVLVASRWEPSAKTCSGCGWVDDDLRLADRTFRGEQCGLLLDRARNAAINLAHLADSSSARQNVGGAASAGYGCAAVVKLATLKQEPDAFDASA